MNLYLGIDFGTTGARSTVIDVTSKIHSETEFTFEGDRAIPSGQPQPELPKAWQTALFGVIEQIPLDIRSQVRAIAIDGTSSTVLLCDTDGNPVDEPILYNDPRGVQVMDRVRAIAPANHAVLSATSSLAKLLWWLSVESSQPSLKSFDPTQPLLIRGESIDRTPLYFLHQADWLAFLLHGKLGISDYHNALKLGYDVANLCYPDWLIEGIGKTKSAIAPILPQVVAPGTAVGKVRVEICDRFNFPRDCIICAGTTDSIAAFLASGVNSPGEAVTSLGSTLAVKLLSHTRVDDARYGIYSHRFTPIFEEVADKFSLSSQGIANKFSLPSQGIANKFSPPSQGIANKFSLSSQGIANKFSLPSQGIANKFSPPSQAEADPFSPPLQGGAGGGLWLVGGASNTGGAVLRHFFTDAELESLSKNIHPEKESLLDYYPLLKKGDRFPINDSELLPKLEPRPTDSGEFLHGLLESMARIEARGYQLLQELGATPLTKVYTAGGGAKNLVWSAIRQRYLKVPVVTPVHTAAAYGSALLAKQGSQSIDFRF
jgi:sugar (pentulose or hexulose) kinase